MMLWTTICILRTRNYLRILLAVFGVALPRRRRLYTTGNSTRAAATTRMTRVRAGPPRRSHGRAGRSGSGAAAWRCRTSEAPPVPARAASSTLARDSILRRRTGSPSRYGRKSSRSRTRSAGSCTSGTAASRTASCWTTTTRHVGDGGTSSTAGHSRPSPLRTATPATARTTRATSTRWPGPGGSTSRSRSPPAARGRLYRDGGDAGLLEDGHAAATGGVTCPTRTASRALQVRGAWAGTTGATATTSPLGTAATSTAPSATRGSTTPRSSAAEIQHIFDYTKRG